MEDDSDEVSCVTRCEYCEGRVDRPGTHGCDKPVHATPDKAQRIVAAIENNLNDRSGMSWDSLDSETVEELRDTLANLVRAELAKPE